jgi:hypothetical protein
VTKTEKLIRKTMAYSYSNLCIWFMLSSDYFVLHGPDYTKRLATKRDFSGYSYPGRQKSNSFIWFCYMMFRHTGTLGPLCLLHMLQYVPFCITILETLWQVADTPPHSNISRSTCDYHHGTKYHHIPSVHKRIQF